MDNQRYSNTAIILHWIVAIFIISLLSVGFFMTSAELSQEEKSSIYQMHKSFGLTLLLIALVRLYYRKSHTPPEYPKTISQLSINLSKAVHYLLYFLILFMPLAGWAMSSSTPPEWKTMFFGLFEWPRIPGLTDNTALRGAFKEMHEVGAYALLLLIALHLIGTLKHLIVEKENLLTRMWFK